MTKQTSHSYFVIMQDYGRRGLEAIVQPEITRREIVARIKSHEYQDIAFIHHVDDGLVEDVTDELIDAAELELKEEHRAARDAARRRDAEPLAQWLNSTFKRTGDLTVELNRSCYRFLSQADVMLGLGIDDNDVGLMDHIATRLQFIATNIRARQATGLRIVKHG